jgi:nucleotide-binding universal stress UspA family protein
MIVAAVDRSDAAKRVPKEAASLAEAFGEGPHIVHVISRSEFTDIATKSMDDAGQSADLDEGSCYPV